MANNSDKKFYKSITIGAIVLLLLNIVAFLIPFEQNSVFWAGYVFAMVSILAQAGVIMLASKNHATTKDNFYAYPIFRMGIIYLAVQMVLSLVLFILATFADDFPPLAAWLACIIVFCVFTVLVLIADTNRDAVSAVEEKTEQQTIAVKKFRVNIDSIVRKADDPEVKKVIEKLAEVAKYSDPVSNDKLAQIESRIEYSVNMLDNAVAMHNDEDAKEIALNIIKLFEDRNALCKLYK